MFVVFLFLFVVVLVNQPPYFPLRTDIEAACAAKIDEDYAQPREMKITQIQFSYSGRGNTVDHPPLRINRTWMSAYANNAADVFYAQCDSLGSKDRFTVSLSDVRFEHR